MYAYIKLTTLTRPKSASVDGLTNFKMAGASSDSVLLAFMTSEGPSAEAIVVILQAEIYK